MFSNENNNNNYKYQQIIDEANNILHDNYNLHNKNKKQNISSENIVLPDYPKQPDINDIKVDEEAYKEKVYELNKERIKYRNENEKVKKLKEKYDNLYSKLQNEIKKFQLNNRKKIENFEKYKEEEKEKINKEKKQLIIEQKEIGELRIKYQINCQLNSKKDKEDIIQLKNLFQKFQEENIKRENNNKILIEKYKRQLDEANFKILKLNGEITKLQTMSTKDEEIEKNLMKMIILKILILIII